jgi:hypothetical protein
MTDRHNLLRDDQEDLGPAPDADLVELLRGLEYIQQLAAGLASPAPAAVRADQYLRVDAVCRWAADVAECLHEDLTGPTEGATA